MIKGGNDKEHTMLLVNGIREHKPGTTVVQKLNQGSSRRLGVISGGGLFWAPFWANKKVHKAFKSIEATELLDKPIAKSIFQSVVS